MSLFFASLNSGSNGNCYYIASRQEAILVDVGLSCRETERRMARLGLGMQQVKAIFISHEHSDHIKGLEAISKKYKLPVYMTDLTHLHSGLYLDETLLRHFSAADKIRIGNLVITPFQKAHDCADPHSFTVSGHGITIGVFTDIGTPCHQLADHFSRCHAAFLEANYDEELLDKGKYPWYLKKRIRGGSGHLSNTQALALFAAHKPPFMSHLLLSHLSKDNNCPILARDLFTAYAGNVQVSVASRYHESELFYIGSPETMPETRLSAHGQVALF